MEKRKNSLRIDANFLRLFGIFVLVIVVCYALQGTKFLNLGNIQSMMKQFPEYGLLAIGIALALIIGGIDLSAVYLANLSAIVAGTFVKRMVPNPRAEGDFTLIILLSFCIAIVVGAICGAVNGLLISKVGIPAILATLGTQSLFWGISVVLTGGSTMSGFPMALSTMMNSKVGFVPVIAIVFFVAAIVVGLIVSRTTLGREMKMYGTNSRATVYAGLNNLRIVVTTHILTGILAALAGIIMWGKYSSTKADVGSTYTMQAILIAVMGGVSPNGGSGSIPGVVLAVLIIQMVSTLMNMYPQISASYRQIIWGLLLLAVMIFNYVIEERKKKAH